MNQPQFLVVTCNLLKAREKSRVQGAIDFYFAPHWLTNWREIIWLLTQQSQSVNYFRQSFENRSKRMIVESYLV